MEGILEAVAVGEAVADAEVVVVSNRDRPAEGTPGIAGTVVVHLVGHPGRVHRVVVAVAGHSVAFVAFGVGTVASSTGSTAVGSRGSVGTCTPYIVAVVVPSCSVVVART